MKNIDDEKMQEFAENSSLKNATEFTSAEQNEILKYQQLFMTLSKGPVAELPENFSANILAQLSSQEKPAFKYSFHLIIGVLCAAAIVVAANIIQNSNIIQLADVFIKYKWVILFCVATILIVHYSDRKYVKNQALPDIM